jgi:hypothetical protein
MQDPNSSLPDLTKTAYNSTFEDLAGVSTLPNNGEPTDPANLGDGSPLYQEDAQFARDAQPANQTNPSSFQGA